MTILIAVFLATIISFLACNRFSVFSREGPLNTAILILNAALVAALFMGFLILVGARLEQRRTVRLHERIAPLVCRINTADRKNDDEYRILAALAVQILQKDISYVNDCIRSAKDHNSGVFDIWFSDELATLDEIVLLK